MNSVFAVKGKLNPSGGLRLVLLLYSYCILLVAYDGTVFEEILCLDDDSCNVEAWYKESACKTPCDAAPNCFSRNRQDCVFPQRTCGNCLKGFIPEPPHTSLIGNSPCVDQSQILSGNLTETEVADIPILSLKDLFSGNVLEKTKAFGSLKDLSMGVGFAYLIDHGIEKDLLKAALADVKAFFSLPMKEKEALYWKNNVGYIRPKGEILDEELKVGDPKESYDMNGEHILNHPRWKNSSLVKYWESMEGLKTQVLIGLTKAIQLWLPEGKRLPDEFLTRAHKDQLDTLRLLNYVPVGVSEFHRCGAHTDYGTITFIVQDSVGGLEVFNRELGKWQAVPFKENAIVVNLADLLARWTNNVFVSTLHRVVTRNKNKGGSTSEKTRNALAFFVQPDATVIINPAEVFGNRVQAKYDPISSGDYLRCRLEKTVDL